MIPNGAVVGSRVGIKLEVRVLRQHERSLRFRRGSIHGDVPLVLRHRVRDACIDATNHAKRRVGGVTNGECNGRFGHTANVPRPVRPVVGTAMQGVGAIVPLRVIGNIVNRVLCISNAVDISTRDRVIDWMSRINGCVMSDGAWSGAPQRLR